MPRKVEISYRTILFTFAMVGAIWLVVQIKDVLFLLFLSIIFMSALNPLVDIMQSLKLPRWLAITIIYIATLGFISMTIASIIPPLVEQTSNLVSQLPTIISTVRLFDIDPSIITSQLATISRLPSNILRFTAGLFSNLVFVFTLAIVTFYLLMERRNLKKYLTIVFNDKNGEKRAEELVDKLEVQLGGWVRGQFILMTVVGILIYIGLILLGVPYSVPLAIIAGLLEVVPTLGPIVSGVPAVLAGFLISPYTALAVVALYFVVQQLENTILVPKIMQRATGVNPLVSLLSLMIGFKLGGPGGAVLAVPIVLIIKIAASELLSSNRFKDL